MSHYYGGKTLKAKQCPQLLHKLCVLLRGTPERPGLASSSFKEICFSAHGRRHASCLRSLFCGHLLGTPALGSQTAQLSILTVPLGHFTVNGHITPQTSPLPSGKMEMIMVIFSPKMVAKVGLENTGKIQRRCHTWHGRTGSLEVVRTRPHSCPLGVCGWYEKQASQ